MYFDIAFIPTVSQSTANSLLSLYNIDVLKDGHVGAET
jgi:hypothetical protein